MSVEFSTRVIDNGEFGRFKIEDPIPLDQEKRELAIEDHYDNFYSEPVQKLNAAIKNGSISTRSKLDRAILNGYVSVRRR